MNNNKTQTFLKEAQGSLGRCMSLPGPAQLPTSRPRSPPPPPAPVEHSTLSHPLGSEPFHKLFSLLGIPFPFSNLGGLHVNIPSSGSLSCPHYYFPSLPSFPKDTSHNCAQCWPVVLGLFASR